MFGTTNQPIRPMIIGSPGIKIEIIVKFPCTMSASYTVTNQIYIHGRVKSFHQRSAAAAQAHYDRSSPCQDRQLHGPACPETFSCEAGLVGEFCVSGRYKSSISRKTSPCLSFSDFWQRLVPLTRTAAPCRPTFPCQIPILAHVHP